MTLQVAVAVKAKGVSLQVCCGAVTGWTSRDRGQLKDTQRHGVCVCVCVYEPKPTLLMSSVQSSLEEPPECLVSVRCWS